MNNKLLIDRNEKRWENATFKAAASKSASSVAKSLVASKDIYLEISNLTGVPWYIIAVIHERESGQRWDRSIAQGDRWDRISTHVPKGRGPFKSFKEAAVDALTNCAPFASRWTDWSAGGALTLLELYNGLGYANKGLPSPYIWSGTNQYKAGKYVADGVFDPDAVDSQLGCAVLLDTMHALDNSVNFEVSPPKVKTPTINKTITQTEADAIDTSKAGPVGNSTDTKPASQSTTIWAGAAAMLTSAGSLLTDWKVVCVLAVAAFVGYMLWQRANKPDIKGIIS